MSTAIHGNPLLSTGFAVSFETSCAAGAPLHVASPARATQESTGVYWVQVYRRLEGFFEVVVANAQHIKAVPGRKTDVQERTRLVNRVRHPCSQRPDSNCPACEAL